LASSCRRIPLLLILCGLALPGGAAVPGESGALDEITINSKKLRELERGAIAAEDRFYERFNTLNTNDDFDIHCQMERETGTKVPRRQCRVRFLVEAGAMDGQDFLRGLTSAAAARGVNTPVAALQMQWSKRGEEYRQMARALLQKDPELMALATEWLRLRGQYDRVYKERHKDRIFLFE
jgi:hypothetical protein